MDKKWSLLFQKKPKKIKILIHPQEIAGIKEGDTVNYSFRLKIPLSK